MFCVKDGPSLACFVLWARHLSSLQWEHRYVSTMMGTFSHVLFSLIPTAIQ